MRISILYKIFGGFFVIILLFAFLFLIFSFSAIKDFHLDSLAQNLENLGRSLEFRIVPDLETGRFGELDAFVKDFGKIDPNKQVRICFGDPIYINGTGKDEHEWIVRFIEGKSKEWA